MQQTQPESGGAVGGGLPCVCRQQGGEAGFAQRGKKIQLHGGVLRCAAGCQQAGQLHDADAGQAVIRELDFAALAGKETLSVQQACVRSGADTCQRPVRLCALQSRQAGVQRLYPAAALGGKPGAETIGAKLRAGLAAHGADDGVCVQGLGRAFRIGELHSVAAPALAQGAHLAAGAHLYPAAHQVVLQQRQHVRRLIGVGVHPPGFIGTGVQTVRLHPAQRVGGVDSTQQRQQCGRVGGEVPLRRDAGVVQITAAIAGCKQFFARLRAALQDRDPGGGGGFGGGKGCRQPGGTSAQNKDLLHGKHRPFREDSFIVPELLPACNAGRRFGKAGGINFPL